MFGTLRLILALLVVASHVDLAHEVDLGAAAVTIFFLLSGFVMTATVRRYYARPGLYGWFLADRAGRILPQYFFWTASCVLYAVLVDPAWQPVGWQEIAENVLLLPAMYAVFDLRPWFTGVRYVSQAWSLSLEWHFYMLLPWLILIPKARRLAGGISLAIFTLATLNIISPYIHSYHLLPGVLFVFLLGSVAYDELGQASSPWERSRLFGPFVWLLLLGIIANTCRTLHLQWTGEVYLGIIAGLPLVLWLARRPAHPVDDWLGNLSYGVFLCHNLVLAVIYRLDFLHARWAVFLATCAGSMIAAAIAYRLVERPFLAWRRGLRRRSSLSESSGG